MTARSRSGSYTVTRPSSRSSPTSTVTDLVPATTWALVMTRSGAYTKPDPSMRREQLGAEPSTLTTDWRELTTTRELASCGSGAATSRARVGDRLPKTSGKPRVSTVFRRASDRAWACWGMTRLTPSRSALLRTELASHGSDDEPSGTAT